MQETFYIRDKSQIPKKTFTCQTSGEFTQPAAIQSVELLIFSETVGFPFD